MKEDFNDKLLYQFSLLYLTYTILFLKGWKSVPFELAGKDSFSNVYFNPSPRGVLQAWVPDLSSHVVACNERPGTQAKRQRYLQFLLYRISCSRSSTPCLWCTGDLLEPSPAREFHTSRAGPTWRSKVMKVINTNQFLTTVVLYEWVAGIACTFWYCPTLECCATLRELTVQYIHIIFICWITSSSTMQQWNPFTMTTNGT